MTVSPILMSSDARLIAELAAAPPSAHPAAVAVDWERPEHRASWAEHRPTDLQVTALRAVRAASPWPVICRVNEVGPGTIAEVELAIDLGADEVLVPMVRTPGDAERVLHVARGRVGVGMMVETREAAEDPAPYAELGLCRAFIGLLDLAIERGTRSVFTALSDGSVDRIVGALDGLPYGFGGLTDPARGHPVPARLLMGDIVRAGCAFSMMRNAFVADAAMSSPARVLAAIRTELERLEHRDAGQVDTDRAALLACVAALDAAPQEDSA